MLPCFFNKKKMRDGIEFGIGKGIAKSDEHKIFGISKIDVTIYGKTNTQTLYRILKNTPVKCQEDGSLQKSY